jgi:erythromycin esterase-like protein
VITRRLSGEKGFNVVAIEGDWPDACRVYRSISGTGETKMHRMGSGKRVSHYFECRLPDQFDAVIHIDRMQALFRLNAAANWQSGELPETYPLEPISSGVIGSTNRPLSWDQR